MVVVVAACFMSVQQAIGWRRESQAFGCYLIGLPGDLGRLKVG